MYCRACNTRIDGADGNCPHCGARLALQRANPGKSGSGGQYPLSPSSANEPVDLELEEEVVESPSKSSSSRAKIVGRPGGKRTRAAKSAPRSAPTPPPATASGSDSGSVAGFDPNRVRELIGAEPELLEPGLEVFEESGESIGIGFDTEVGLIDLLAVDGAGAFVVVLVADGEPGREFISNALERVGWVRTHKSKSGESVRAIILAAGFGEDLGYAAAAVADTLSFKSWRVQIAIEDVAV